MSFEFGEKIGSYKIVKQIGRGGGSEVYLVLPYGASDKTTGAAMKIEAIGGMKRGLLNEKKFIDMLDGDPRFPRLLACGEDRLYRYMVMGLMGPSMMTVLRCCGNRRLTMATVVRVAEWSLDIIETMHSRGIVHRDIKPENLLIRPGSSEPLGLIDFGVAKFYMDPETSVIYRRAFLTGFKGTPRYASVQALCGMDQCRRDDMYSWFYVICEMLQGSLPWVDKRTNCCLKGEKMKFADTVRQSFPRQFHEIMMSIGATGFRDAPEYEFIREKIREMTLEYNVDTTTPLDWEEMSEDLVREISLFPLKRPENEDEEPEMYEILDIMIEHDWRPPIDVISTEEFVLDLYGGCCLSACRNKCVLL